MNVEGHTYLALRLRGHTPAAPDSTRDDPEHWTEAALCAQTDPELFHPESKGASIAAARRVCLACPVTTQCLEANLAEQYGVFGNTSPKQRAAIRKARKDAA